MDGAGCHLMSLGTSHMLIIPNHSLAIVFPVSPSLKIFQLRSHAHHTQEYVKILSGKMVFLDVVSALSGLHPMPLLYQQRLIFAGKKLDDKAYSRD
jgi:hypothetical protein